MSFYLNKMRDDREAMLLDRETARLTQVFQCMKTTVCYRIFGPH